MTHITNMHLYCIGIAMYDAWVVVELIICGHFTDGSVCCVAHNISPNGMVTAGGINSGEEYIRCRSKV